MNISKLSIFNQGMLIAVISAVIDQISKIYIFKLLDGYYPPVIEITPFFNLVKVENYGVSFGMFNDLVDGRLILSIVAIIITLILCYWLKKSDTKYMAVSLGLIIGGAVGNIIDRVRVGAVADFLDFHVAGYHWPAFNVADTTVFIGVVMIILEGFFIKEEKADK